MKRLNAKVRLACLVAKPGEHQDECQDAVAAEPGKGLFAIADGATTSFFPRPWAQRLVERFRDTDAQRAQRLVTDASAWPQWLESAIARWRADVKVLVAAAGEREGVLLRNRLHDDDPAAATFVGLYIEPGSSSWRAVAVGDSCLFHIRDDGLLATFPVETSEEFGTTPACIMTTAKGTPDYRFRSGTAAAGDLFFLATDATAKWLLLQHEHGRSAWQNALRNVLVLRGGEEFRAWVERTRQDRVSLDDDVGLLVVSIEETEEAPSRDEKDTGVLAKLKFPKRAVERRLEKRRLEKRKKPVVNVAAAAAAAASKNELFGIVAILIAVLLFLASAAIGIQTRRKIADLQARVKHLEALTDSLRGSTIPQDTDTASAPPRSATLSIGPIFDEQRDGARAQMDLQQPFIASLTPAASGWNRVDLEFWIVAKTSTGSFADTTGARATTTKKVNARLTPEIRNDNIIGIVQPGGPFVVLADTTDSESRFWLHIRASGYVPAFRTLSPQ